MKQLSVQLVKAFLMRQGVPVFIPCTPCGYDLLALFNGCYCRVLCLSVSEPKPIVALKTTRAGVSVQREFDLLYCVHTNSLAIWRFPVDDVPDKESIYLSARYDSYKIPFLGVRPDRLNLPETRTFEEVREELEKDRNMIKDAFENEQEIDIDDILGE